METFQIVTNLKLTLTPGHSVIVCNPDSFNSFALIECKKNRTQITLLDDIKNIDSNVMAAFQDEKMSTFSIDNTILDAIVGHTSICIDDLISLLEYHENVLNQEALDVLMQKIYNLRYVYAPEYILSEISKMSETSFESFLENDNTLSFFKNNCMSEEDDF